MDYLQFLQENRIEFQFSDDIYRGQFGTDKRQFPTTSHPQSLLLCNIADKGEMMPNFNKYKMVLLKGLILIIYLTKFTV